MGRASWDNIKSSKGFYVQAYRKIGSLLVFSIFLNNFLFLGIIHAFFNIPHRVYYSTNGVTPPMPLTTLWAPNESNIAIVPQLPKDFNYREF
ncbi:MAG: phosphoesterase [Legionellaceae bacterium]|nr:phosphoesterase [Legionellaceae bacterium]